MFQPLHHPRARLSLTILLAVLAACAGEVNDADGSLDLSAPPSAQALAAVRAPAGFRGTLPCADCPGIRTTLELEEDGSATLDRLYLDAEEGRDVSRTEPGRWTVDPAGRLLVAPDEGEPLYFAFDRGGLLALDREGGTYASELPRLLERLPRGAAAELTGTAWAIVEPADEPESQAPADEPGAQAPAVSAFLRFDTEGRITGSDGCNELVGAWRIDEGRLSILPAAASMHECPAPAERRALRIEAALEAAAAYRLDDGHLVLLATDDTELARLRPIA